MLQLQHTIIQIHNSIDLRSSLLFGIVHSIPLFISVNPINLLSHFYKFYYHLLIANDDNELAPSLVNARVPANSKR